MAAAMPSLSCFSTTGPVRQYRHIRKEHGNQRTEMGEVSEREQDPPGLRDGGIGEQRRTRR